MSEKTYILKKECKNIGKEAGDYYNGEYGDSPEKIADLIERGVIEEEVAEVPKDDIDYIVWDIETTGFVPPEAVITELGCFIVRGFEVEQRHWVFQNNVEIPEKITELTGITKEIIDAEGTDPKQNLLEFLPLFKKAKKNITHNGVRFDIPFLIGYAKHVLGWSAQEEMAVTNLIRSTAFDTAVDFKAEKLGHEQEPRESYAQFADRVMNERVAGLKFNLGLVCDEKKIDRSNVVQHRALADVYLTHEVYKKTAHGQAVANKRSLDWFDKLPS